MVTDGRRSSASALDDLPPVFRQSEAARAGLDSRSLYRHRDAGQLEVIGRGLYRKADPAPVDLDLLEIATRSPRGTICLVSALAVHELIDEIPTHLHVALPRGARPPRVGAAARWHVFDRDTFNVGRAAMPIAGTPQEIGLYTAERSIVDTFRLRGQHGYEVGIQALRTWLRRRGSNPAALLRIADQLPRAHAPLREALSYLA